MDTMCCIPPHPFSVSSVTPTQDLRFEHNSLFSSVESCLLVAEDLGCGCPFSILPTLFIMHFFYLSKREISSSLPSDTAHFLYYFITQASWDYFVYLHRHLYICSLIFQFPVVFSYPHLRENLLRFIILTPLILRSVWPVLVTLYLLLEYILMSADRTTKFLLSHSPF